MAGTAHHTANCLFDFGSIADEYDAWYETPAGWAYDRVQKADVRRFLRRRRPGSRLLDVGCGTGHWSRFFASLGYAVVGLDISKRMIETAKAKTPAGHCVFEVADACNMPLRNSSFDVVAAMATLEFVPDVYSALTEMFRCVKSGGRVLIGTLNRLAPINLHRLAEEKQPYVSGRLLAPDELRDLLEPFGRVRMVASSEVSSNRAVGQWRTVGRRATRGREKLSGAFIVAEVRT